MNGDDQQIFNAVRQNGTDIAVLRKQQDLQHRENKSDIEEIKKKVNGINNLKGQLVGQWFLIAGLFAWTFFK